MMSGVGIVMPTKNTRPVTCSRSNGADASARSPRGPVQPSVAPCGAGVVSDDDRSVGARCLNDSDDDESATYIHGSSSVSHEAMALVDPTTLAACARSCRDPSSNP